MAIRQVHVALPKHIMCFTLADDAGDGATEKVVVIDDGLTFIGRGSTKVRWWKSDAVPERIFEDVGQQTRRTDWVDSIEPTKMNTWVATEPGTIIVGLWPRSGRLLDLAPTMRAAAQAAGKYGVYLRRTTTERVDPATMETIPPAQALVLFVDNKGFQALRAI